MDRFFKERRDLPSRPDPDKIFIPVDSPLWKRSYTISLENLGEILSLKVEKDLSRWNVSSRSPEGYEGDPNKPPEGSQLQDAQIAVDENWLYVWVSKSGRWKRIPLSNWS